MRIAMLHVDLPPESGGGVAQQVVGLSEAMARRGHDVLIRSFSSAIPGSNFDVHRIRFPDRIRKHRPVQLAAVPLYFAGGNYRKFDVVHAHGDSQLLWRRRTPVVRTFYGSARDEAIHAARLRRRLGQCALVPAERAARRLAAVSVGISRATQRSIGPMDAIIPCGVDLDRFQPGQKSAAPSVLFVGTMTGRKRGSLLLQAFSESVRSRLPEAELWVVSAERAEGPGVRWLGRVDDGALARLFSQAWVFCLPSSYEGFGVPYIEAMASGTPVVATANPGANEVIASNSAGLIVRDDDLGPAIADLLGNCELRNALAATGRCTAQAYRWDRVCDDYEDVYELACHRVSGSPERTDPSKRRS